MFWIACCILVPPLLLLLCATSTSTSLLLPLYLSFLYPVQCPQNPFPPRSLDLEKASLSSTTTLHLFLDQPIALSLHSKSHTMTLHYSLSSLSTLYPPSIHQQSIPHYPRIKQPLHLHSQSHTSSSTSRTSSSSPSHNPPNTTPNPKKPLPQTPTPKSKNHVPPPPLPDPPLPARPLPRRRLPVLDVHPHAADLQLRVPRPRRPQRQPGPALRPVRAHEAGQWRGDAVLHAESVAAGGGREVRGLLVEFEVEVRRQGGRERGRWARGSSLR